MKELKDYTPAEFETKKDEINSLLIEEADDCAAKRLEEEYGLPFEDFTEPDTEDGEEADENTPTRFKKQYQDKFNEFYDQECDRLTKEIGFDYNEKDGIRKNNR